MFSLWFCTLTALTFYVGDALLEDRAKLRQILAEVKVKLERCILRVHKSPSISLYFCFSTHYLAIKVNLMTILLPIVVRCLNTLEEVINSNIEGWEDATGAQSGCTTAHLMIKAGVRIFSFNFGFATFQIWRLKQALLIFYKLHNYKLV